jgi:hypothetical protein
MLRDMLETNQTTARIVRASALYDLLAMLPFATPWSARLLIGALGQLHSRLGLAGHPPPTDAATVMFACLLGIVVTMWSVVRLRNPSAFHGAVDTAGRALFSLTFVTTLGAGATSLVVPFLVLEVFWGIVQGIAVVQAYRRASWEQANAHW